MFRACSAWSIRISRREQLYRLPRQVSTKKATSSSKLQLESQGYVVGEFTQPCTYLYAFTHHENRKDQ